MPSFNWPVRRCSTCRQHLALDFFPRNRSRKDGLHTECRDCSAARGLRYYYANREKVLAHYAAHKEVVSAAEAEAAYARAAIEAWGSYARTGEAAR
jgi:hypothetical protein